MLMALFFVKFSFAQNSTLIDTCHTEFNKKLEAIYSLHNEFIIDSIQNPEVRKLVAEIRQKNDSTFKNKIRSGIFINEKRYNDYTNKIFSTLQNANKHLKAVSFLISLEDESNAYNTGENTIVINLSLFKELNNEYELAFIISHEIAHQFLEHVWHGTIRYAENTVSDKVKVATKRIEKLKYHKSQYAGLIYKDFIYQDRKTLRQMENEADSLGFIIYKNAYPKNAGQAIRALEILDSIDVDKDSIAEKEYRLWFDSEKQPFKKEWIANNELQGYAYENNSKFWQTDSLKTHPDCVERIRLLKEKQEDIINIEVKDTEYILFKTTVSYDFIFGLYFIKEYGRSLYETLLLLKKDPKNEWLKTMVYNNLIQIQKARAAYTLNKNVSIINPRFSESYNRFLYFIRKLRKAELANIIDYYKPL